jgi:Concanavalin A-like lectin/glucanases superfamily
MNDEKAPVSEVKQCRESFPSGKLKAAVSGGFTTNGEFRLHGKQAWYYENGQTQWEVHYDAGSKGGRRNSLGLAGARGLVVATQGGWNVSLDAVFIEGGAALDGMKNSYEHHLQTGSHPAETILCLLSSALLEYWQSGLGQTIALWPFDEQAGLYPSSVLSDVSTNDYPLVIGLGGQIVPGKFGNALEPFDYPPIEFPEAENPQFGLGQVVRVAGRKLEPLTWRTARFCGYMTAGENHLRKDVGFPNPSATQLNLGAFDWTVEFWFFPTRKGATDGVVFEIGKGPRGENDEFTQLALTADQRSFILSNQPGRVRLVIATDQKALTAGPAWHHLAFVYSHSESKLRHYVDGKEQPAPKRVALKALEPGEEAYFSVGRDALWQRPLPGKIDELRFSAGVLYTRTFTPPSSFSPLLADSRSHPGLKEGPPLLFAGQMKGKTPVPLMHRKYLFIDDALAQEVKDVVLRVNPPLLAECVIDNIQGPFRKHVNVVEDETGVIRMYYGSQKDSLAVQISKDGIHFEAPRLPNASPGMPHNVVLAEPTAMGMVFSDPNAPPEERWRFLSDFHRRGIFLFSSADGFSFKRHPIAILPFRSGSQSNVFYDEQRQLYVAYHRTDFPRTASGKTQREFVLTETREIAKPWPFTPITAEALEKVAQTKRLHRMRPFFLDNGPLTPGGFGAEYPTAFGPDDALDPPGTDVYVPKAIKYPWAPDTYLAFPLMYFHYEGDGPDNRQVLGEEKSQRGSGPIETQMAVSRDGIQWKRYPRPAYVGLGSHHGDPIHQAYLAQGMIRRGSEIWQYYFGEEAYHSSWKPNLKRAVYRLVQRVDGFVAAEAPYDRMGTIRTRPLVFKGNRLVLNIDTDAAGFAQVGFLDENGKPIEGYSVDECVYINGDFVDTEVEWLRKGKDLASLQGKVVQAVFRMRGSKLYSLQFLTR